MQSSNIYLGLLLVNEGLSEGVASILKLTPLKNQFTTRQACYSKGHSTQPALLGVLGNICKAVEDR